MNHVNEVQLGPIKQRNSNMLGPEERHVRLKLGWTGERNLAMTYFCVFFLKKFCINFFADNLSPNIVFYS